MRKYFTVTVIVAVVFSGIFSTVSASTDSARTAKTPLEDMKPGLNQCIEKDEIFKLFNEIDTIERNLISSYGRDEDNESKYKDLRFDPDTAYKIYMCLTPNLVTAFEKTKNFSELITNEYMWKIPIKNPKDEIVSIVSIYKYDGQWEIGVYGKAVENEVKMLSNYTVLQEQLKKASIDSSHISDIKAVFLSRFYGNVLFIESDDAQLMIPISTIESLTPALKNNKVYTVDAFFQTLNLYSSETEVQAFEVDGTFGGTHHDESRGMLNILILGIIIAVISVTIPIILTLRGDMLYMRLRNRPTKPQQAKKEHTQKR